ncbi:MAG: hypothetical protein PHU14_01175 [Methylovulum sp.]|nr:hypothetical protein [Methylovulum sp.]
MKRLSLCCLLLASTAHAQNAPKLVDMTVTGLLAYDDYAWREGSVFSVDSDGRMPSDYDKPDPRIIPQHGPAISFATYTNVADQVFATCQGDDICTVSGIVSVDAHGRHLLTKVHSVRQVKAATIGDGEAIKPQWVRMTVTGELNVSEEESSIFADTAPSTDFSTDVGAFWGVFQRCHAGDICRLSGWVEWGGVRPGQARLEKLLDIRRLSPDMVIAAVTPAIPEPDTDLDYRWQGHVSAGKIKRGQDAGGEGAWLDDGKHQHRLCHFLLMAEPDIAQLEKWAAAGDTVTVQGTLNTRKDGSTDFDNRVPVRIFK